MASKKTKKRSGKTAGSTSRSSPSTMHDLLLIKLRALRDVEGQIIKALPKLAKAASDPKLRQAFEDHLQETKTQEQRLDRSLEILGEKSKSKIVSEAIRGLVDDGSWVIKSVKDEAARDAMLVAAAQYVEHYEIAGYGTAITWAEMMGQMEIAELLKETLDEEENADTTLSALAEGSINEKVESGTSEDEESDETED